MSVMLVRAERFVACLLLAGGSSACMPVSWWCVPQGHTRVREAAGSPVDVLRDAAHAARRLPRVATLRVCVCTGQPAGPAQQAHATRALREVVCVRYCRMCLLLWCFSMPSVHGSAPMHALPALFMWARAARLASLVGCPAPSSQAACATQSMQSAHTCPVRAAGFTTLIWLVSHGERTHHHHHHASPWKGTCSQPDTPAMAAGASMIDRAPGAAAQQ